MDQGEARELARGLLEEILAEEASQTAVVVESKSTEEVVADAEPSGD